jgi:hypothetical protein
VFIALNGAIIAANASFLEDTVTPEPSYAQWLERLEERLARADTLAAQQRDGLIAALGRRLPPRESSQEDPDGDVAPPGFRAKPVEGTPADGASPPSGGVAPAA